jgi:hypothetical protein
MEKAVSVLTLWLAQLPNQICRAARHMLPGVEEEASEYVNHDVINVNADSKQHSYTPTTMGPLSSSALLNSSARPPSLGCQSR